jgi:hypothetical protein
MDKENLCRDLRHDFRLIQVQYKLDRKGLLAMVMKWMRCMEDELQGAHLLVSLEAIN